jgi:hypothetical protein
MRPCPVFRQSTPGSGQPEWSGRRSGEDHGRVADRGLPSTGWRPTVADHRVKLTLTLFLMHDLAEWITARAIREGKNTPGVIADILTAEAKRK